MSADPAERIEDLEFLDSTGVGATEAAERSGFPSAEAMEKWLERHDRYDLWLRMKRRDPEGEHCRPAHKRERRRPAVAQTDTDTLANLLDNGDASTRARTRKKAERARALLHELRVILNAEAEEDERVTQAAAEVERLTRELAEAKARMRGTTTLTVGSSISAAELRAWARENGVECPPMGRVPAAVREAYEAEADEQAAS